MPDAFDDLLASQPDEPVGVAENVMRLTAPNPGPFTFQGTNTYIVGRNSVAIIDPGPNNDRHLQALIEIVGNRRVEAVLVTHTHLDHSGLASRIALATGAPTIAEGPHRAARPLHEGEANEFEAAADKAFRPDRRVADGERIDLAAGRFCAVATPGHTANHMAYALDGTGLLFCGDHVMSWSTTVVAPPDGAMNAFMASLDKLLTRDDTLYLPGHGEIIRQPKQLVRAVSAHRRMREAAIRERLAAGDRTVMEIVAALYGAIDPRLHAAAASSVFAHLEDLAARRLVRCAGAPVQNGTFHPA